MEENNMGELRPQSFEQHESFDLLEKAEHEPKSLPDHEHAQQENTEVDPLQRMADARAEASVNAAESNPLEQFAQQAAHDATPSAPKTINRELRKITYKRELRHIQRRESAPDRALSKVIHQPVVRAVSEAAGRTVSRPSGLLGGGIVAFIGTTGYLYVAKHYGFEYNYLIFIGLFIGGFALGLAFEIVSWLILSAKRRSQA
jgi:hypothetical protein